MNARTPGRFSSHCGEPRGRAAAGLAGAVGQLARGADRRFLQHRGGGHLVHETDAAGAARVQLLAGKHQVERGADPDEARQALRPSRAGADAQLHLGETELGFGMPSLAIR